MTDSSASANRTRMSWRRTALTGTAAALLAVRPAFADASPASVLLAAAAMTGWAMLVALAYHRNRGLAAGPPRPSHRTVVLCAAITVGFVVIGGLVVTL